MGRSGLLALCLGLAAHGAAHAAPPPLDPDLLTISGRQALPTGAGSALEGRLRLSEVSFEPATATAFQVSPEALKAALQQALDKSLLNHRYEASSPPAGVLSLQVELAPIEVKADAAGASATATLKVRAADAAPQCFPYEAKGAYHALLRERSGGGRRAFGVATTVALAFAGVAAAPLLTSQFETASAENRLRNAGRPLKDNEGVASGFGPDAAVASAALNATRAAVADLIVHLADAERCAGHGKTPAPAELRQPGP